MEPKFPDIKVKLSGNDGNAFYIIGVVKKAMKEHRVPQETITEFVDDCMDGDYNKLLRTCMQWVNVE